MDENKINDVRAEEQAQVEAEVGKETAAEAETESIGTQEEVIIEEKQKTGFVGFIKNCFSRKNIKKTIAVILLVLIAGGAAGAYFHFTSPEYVALKYGEAVATWDLKGQAELAAYDFKSNYLYSEKTHSFTDEETYFEDMSDQLNEDITNWDEYFEAVRQFLSDTYESVDGEYTVTCELTRTKDVSVKKVYNTNKDFISRIERTTDFDYNDVDECKQITVKAKYDTDEEGIQRRTIDIFLVKINGSWRVLTYASEFLD